MRSKFLLFSLTLCTMGSALLPAQNSANLLADNTVLLVRHAEKPPSGSGLTPLGEARAREYATYFVPFREDGFSLGVDSLYAGADSAKSLRPRMTLEPLSRATGLPLHATVGTKDSELLVSELKTEVHGHVPLISWRHSEIPALLTAFGASPDALLPNGKWPDDVFDWVIVLKFDHAGHLSSTRLIKETLKVSVPAS